MKAFLYILLGGLFRTSCALILHHRPATHRIPESKKLEVRFRNDGQLTEILTPHILTKINDGNSPQVIVNGRNPYVAADNIDPYLIAFDKVYNAHRSDGLSSDVLTKRSKSYISSESVLKDMTSPHSIDISAKSSMALEDNDNNTANGYYDTEDNIDHAVGVPADGFDNPESLANHLQVSLESKSSNAPLVLNPTEVQMIINNLNKLQIQSEIQPQHQPEDIALPITPEADIQEIENIHQTSAELKDKIIELKDQIEKLDAEIEELNQNNRHSEAEQLLEQQNDLQQEEKILELEADQQEDVELREEISNLEEERVNLIGSNASDQQLAHVDGEIEAFEEDLAHIDEDIKQKEIENIISEVDQWEESKSNTKSEGDALQIKQKEESLLSEAKEIAENTQIEKEIEINIGVDDQEIKILEHDGNHPEELRQLKRIRRKLQDLEHEIKQEDEQLITEVEQENEKIISNENIYQESDDNTSSDPEHIEIDQDHPSEQSEDVHYGHLEDTIPGIQDELNVDEPVIYTHVPLMIDLLGKITVEYRKMFESLPDKIEDVPPNSQEHTNELNIIFEKLQKFINSFDSSKPSITDEFNDLKDRVDRINTEYEGIIEFYNLVGIFNHVRNTVQTPSKLYLMKLSDIKLEAETIGIKVWEIFHSLESIENLETWIDDELNVVRYQINLPNGPGIVEINSMAAELTPKFITARNDVHIVIEEIMNEFKYIQRARETFVNLIYELYDLAGIEREKWFSPKKEMPFTIMHRYPHTELIRKDYYWQDDEYVNSRLRIIQQHLAQGYNIAVEKYTGIYCIFMGFLVILML